MTPPLSLTDRQLRYVTSAAASVPVQCRDDFLQSVARRLAAEPSDAAVQAAVNVALNLVPAEIGANR